MALAVGTKLGPYEILALIGTGGMGEVYRARDIRLNRTVAVKVAKEQFSERFHKEAEAIAALNHPNICQLYDVGPNYLVMEYVEGAPLKGPLPLDLALKYADQICQALDAAHTRAVTHRDLKPENILVTKTAGIKLLDFGLARLEGSANSTVTIGEVKGTPAYMSPEQWDGKSGDARSDIYAFGCVLYEVLTGKRAAVQRTELDPPALESIVRTCLEREPEARWQTASDLRRALALPSTTPAPKRTPRLDRTAWIVAGLLAIGLIAVLVSSRPVVAPTEGALTRFSIFPPQDTQFTGPNITTVAVPQFAFSPDGQYLAFTASTSFGRPQLWLRKLSELRPRPIPETEGADYPFWSPDSRWIGYFAREKMKKVPITEGPSQVIVELVDSRGASWGPDGTILFATGTTGLFRVSSTGGSVTPVTKLDPQEGSHRWPFFLPNGRDFLFTVRSSVASMAGVYIGSLDGRPKKLILLGVPGAIYVRSGDLLYLDGDTLMAQPFNAERLSLSGQPTVVESQVGIASNGFPALSASQTGIIGTGSILSVGSSRLTWFDRGGKPQQPVGAPADYADFGISPDSTRLAASLVDHKSGLTEIWMLDLVRGSAAPFTFGPAMNGSPVWSPDGGRIIFRSTRTGGSLEFYQKSAGGGGLEEGVLLTGVARGAGLTSLNLGCSDWSPDGSTLIFSGFATTDFDIWTLSMNGAPKPASLLAAPGDQMHAKFSPDGRLIAYSSNESGRFEVHVQTFPITDRQWTISNAGGYEPRWRGDGRELYYLSEDRKLMAVPVGSGPTFGTPQPLFQTSVALGVSIFRNHYVPSRDGRRFLVNTQIGDPVPSAVNVILNWTAAPK
jgi:eukaryotic-like serine/threonine-protein kinase